MLINKKQTDALRRSITQAQETFCNGLFLSARWFVVSAAAYEGINLIVLPNREAAEYCAADLYHLTEGDCVFYLPDSGKSLEKSNFKASLGVQRTSALGKILKESSEKLFLVTYPEALSEPVPAAGTIQKTALQLRKELEISHEKLVEQLDSLGFERVDFVARP